MHIYNCQLMYLEATCSIFQHLIHSNKGCTSHRALVKQEKELTIVEITTIQTAASIVSSKGVLNVSVVPINGQPIVDQMHATLKIVSCKK